MSVGQGSKGGGPLQRTRRSPGGARACGTGVPGTRLGQGDRPRTHTGERGVSRSAPRVPWALTVHTCVLSSAVYRMPFLPCNGFGFSGVSSASARGPMGPAGGEPRGRTAACHVRQHTKCQEVPEREAGLVLVQAIPLSRPVPVLCPMSRLQAPPSMFSSTRARLVRPIDTRVAPVPHEACGQTIRTWLAPRMSAQCSSFPGVRQNGRYCGLLVESKTGPETRGAGQVSTMLTPRERVFYAWAIVIFYNLRAIEPRRGGRRGYGKAKHPRRPQAIAADLVQGDDGSGSDGLPQQDGVTALSGTRSLDTATARLRQRSRPTHGLSALCAWCSPRAPSPSGFGHRDAAPQWPSHHPSSGDGREFGVRETREGLRHTGPGERLPGHCCSRRTLQCVHLRARLRRHGAGPGRERVPEHSQDSFLDESAIHILERFRATHAGG
jgi:hypothetical protein